jgi:hypothetical protein
MRRVTYKGVIFYGGLRKLVGNEVAYFAFTHDIPVLYSAFLVFFYD